MRKNNLFLVMSVLAIATLMFSITAVSAIATGSVSINDKTTNKLTANNNRALESMEFIHYKNGMVKVSVSVSKASLPACSAFLTSTKIKWNTLPVNYIINPTNSQSLTQDFIEDAIKSSAETWDSATGKELMNDAYEINYSAKWGVVDNMNTISFGNYPKANVIAVTRIWYYSSTREIVDFDIMFDTDFKWGDATVDKTKMDLQNIATHELGHGVGLGDIYKSSCSTVTMYGYSWNGDIQKRTLEAGDIRGIQTLYGA